MKFRLQLVLAAVLTLVAILPVALLGAAMFRIGAERELESATERYLLVVRNIKTSLSRYAMQASTDFEHMIAMVTAEGASEYHWDTVGISFKRFCLMRADDGGVFPQIPALAEQCKFQDETIAALRANTSDQSMGFSPVMRGDDGNPTIFLYRQLGGDAFAIGELRLKFLKELQRAVAFGAQGHAVILDRTGQVIAHPNHDWQQEIRSLAEVDPVVRMMARETGVTTFYSPFLKGDVVTGFTTVPRIGWGVMVGQPLEELNANATAARTLAFVMTLVGVVVAVALSWLVARFLGRSVEAVAGTAQRLASGDPQARVDTNARFLPKEFRDLGSTFNAMADEIAAHQLSRDVLAKRESDEQLGRITANIPGLVFRRIQEPDGVARFSYFHTGRDNVFDVHISEGLVQVESLCSILHPDDHQVWLDAVSASAASLQPFDIQFRIGATSMDCKWARAIVHPRRQSSGAIVWEGIALDISAQKVYEQQLIAAKEEAEQINQSKSRFLAAASHDLRQPLQVMSWLIGLLKGRMGTPSDRQLVEDLANAQAIMGNLLNALLNISQLESGAIEPEISDQPVRTLLNQISNAYQEQSLIAGRPLSSKKPQIKLVASSAMFRSDPVLLRSILDNFVANALHHAEATKIVIGCRRRGDNLSLQVWDNGIGIRKADQEVIFEEFYQVANASRDRSKGLGLGLAIVDRTARLLGHKVEVRSVVGGGSMFAVSVPLGRRKSAENGARAQAPAPNLALHGRSILLIEDDQMVLNASQELLGRWGAKVSSARDSEEALSVVGNGTPPDLIIGDHRLPGDTTGVELVERLRALCGRRIPAVIITGDTAVGSLPAFQGGDLQILYKPVQPAKLLALLRHMMSAGQAG